ncbi:hypothetical protein PHLCEN_2v3936 [Hermanssonia centrifuga]|uniref:Uncharacterized protein n=1 Tax=Hermanssonia centrifuga TaxID=98765 RepID=A0A2R6QB37_9APHY|nr:hypothetical protein PHLCEN_2v3936 [Hermanssonia centrifuga]
MQSPSTPEEQKNYLLYAGELKYLEVVGAVFYATQTQPDIQHAIGVLAQFGSNPGKPHLEALKQVLRYLQGTAHFSLRLGGGSGNVDLIGWTDSDWASNVDLRCSIAGYVFKMTGGCISWSFKKQPTVALSTVEAEYMVSANAAKEAI